MALWAKLYVDILGDPKLMSAAREGKKNLDVTPWLFAFSKLANAAGRLEINGKRADSRDIAALLPGISASRVAKSREELLAIGVLALDEDGCDYFVQWEKRSGDGKKPEGSKSANALRQQRYRERHRNGNALRNEGEQPLVTPLRNSAEIEIEQEKERRAESVTPSRNGVTRHEPGSAAALVAPLPNCEEPKVDYPTLASDQPLPTNLERLDDLPTERRVMTEAEVRERFPEIPAETPEPSNGKHEAPTPLDVVLPHAAVRFGKTFYPRGTATDARRTDVFEQLTAVLTKPGLAFNGGIIHVTPARLSAACLAVLKSHEKGPLENPDSAIVYLLTKLSDVSQDSPTEKAAVEARVEEQNDRMTFAERKERALKIAAERPEEHQRLTEAAKRIFPGKDKDMEQPRLAYVITQLLRLEPAAATQETR